MSRDGTIRKTKDGYETRFERHLDHTVDDVWAMLTEPDEIRKWYVRVEVEPRVGGRIVEHHEHAGATGEGRILAFDPPRLLEYTWWSEDIVMRWELTPKDDGCLLVMTMRTEEPNAGAAAGWHICLDVLEDVLGGASPETSAPPRGQADETGFTETAPGRGRWTQRHALEARYGETVEALTKTA